MSSAAGAWTSRDPNTGPSSALNVKLMKLMMPVAEPPSSGGLASLMTEYGSIAAPEATPIRMPTTGPRKMTGSPNRTHANTPSSTITSKAAPAILAAASKLKGAQVVMVYPGPAERAREFTKDWTLPTHFHLVLDPDYTFTNAWHLRWDEPMETAYPSTFVIGTDGKVRFAKVSKTHGGRSSVDEVLSALEAK